MCSDGSKNPNVLILISAATTSCKKISKHTSKMDSRINIALLGRIWGIAIDLLNTEIDIPVHTGVTSADSWRELGFEVEEDVEDGLIHRYPNNPRDLEFAVIMSAFVTSFPNALIKAQ